MPDRMFQNFLSLLKKVVSIKPRMRSIFRRPHIHLDHNNLLHAVRRYCKLQQSAKIKFSGQQQRKTILSLYLQPSHLTMKISLCLQLKSWVKISMIQYKIGNIGPKSTSFFH